MLGVEPQQRVAHARLRGVARGLARRAVELGGGERGRERRDVARRELGERVLARRGRLEHLPQPPLVEHAVLRVLRVDRVDLARDAVRREARRAEELREDLERAAELSLASTSNLYSVRSSDVLAFERPPWRASSFL